MSKCSRSGFWIYSVTLPVSNESVRFYHSLLTIAIQTLNWIYIHDSSLRHVVGLASIKQVTVKLKKQNKENKYQFINIISHNINPLSFILSGFNLKLVCWCNTVLSCFWCLCTPVSTYISFAKQPTRFCEQIKKHPSIVGVKI